MTEICTDDDDDGWHDNYDGDGDNINEIHDKNYQNIARGTTDPGYWV